MGFSCFVRRPPRGLSRVGRCASVLAPVLTTFVWACVLTATGPAADERCVVPGDLGAETLIEAVTVVDYLDGSLRENADVLIVGGRIRTVGPSGEVAAGAEATRVPGCGRFLSPGLADMHVHLTRDDIPRYLAAGVTTVRNLWGFPDLLRMVEEVEGGRLVGPTIYTVSSGLDGDPPKWPVTQLVHTPEDAARIVREQVALGYGTLKLYQDLRPEPFEAVVAEAAALDVDFGGHVPHRVGLPGALAAGYRFIEHLSGYEPILNGTGARGAGAWRYIDHSEIARLVDLTLDAGTWNVPTLEIFDQLAGRDAETARNRYAMVRALFEAGAPLLVGTDSGIGRTQPGVSVHSEIAHFQEAGLTPVEALRLATTEAARFLGAERDFGRVVPGLRADLILTEADPRLSPSVLAEPVAVVARGRRVR